MTTGDHKRKMLSFIESACAWVLSGIDIITTAIWGTQHMRNIVCSLGMIMQITWYSTVQLLISQYKNTKLMKYLYQGGRPGMLIIQVNSNSDNTNNHGKNYMVFDIKAFKMTRNGQLRREFFDDC